jgi:hypothetical protein
MSSRRVCALTLATFLLVAGCASRTTPSSRGSSSPKAAPSRSGGTTYTPKPATGPSTTAGRGSTPPATFGGGAPPVYDDAGGVGAMARTYLRSAPAASLRVEVDYVEGRVPQQSALDHLRSELVSVVDKPGGVSVELGRSVAASRQTWSVGDIEALERSTRLLHSSGTTATMWFVYLNGSYAGGSSTLGLSFEASSAAIFLDQIQSATTAVVQEPAIERAVLTHEAGHLLALVNIGYRSRYDHEDPQHPHHSKYSSDVMYWQVEDASIKNLLSGGPPDDYDQYDRADLQMLKDGG